MIRLRLCTTPTFPLPLNRFAVRLHGLAPGALAGQMRHRLSLHDKKCSHAKEHYRRRRCSFISKRFNINAFRITFFNARE